MIIFRLNYVLSIVSSSYTGIRVVVVVVVDEFCGTPVMSIV